MYQKFVSKYLTLEGVYLGPRGYATDSSLAALHCIQSFYAIFWFEVTLITHVNNIRKIVQYRFLLKSCLLKPNIKARLLQVTFFLSYLKFKHLDPRNTPERRQFSKKNQHSLWLFNNSAKFNTSIFLDYSIIIFLLCWKLW